MVDKKKESQGNVSSSRKAGEIEIVEFCLGEKYYGINVMQVREIIRASMGIVPVSNAHPSISGVINLRGKVIPVVALRSKFGLDTQEDTEKTCIIVVEVNKGDLAIEMGMLVDSVSEVLDIDERDVEAAPEFEGNLDTQFILGVAKARDGVKILLDVDRVITPGEQAAITETKTEKLNKGE